MTISIVDGNILDGDWDILIQSVNHWGVMGAGLAKQIADRYPDIVKPYKKFCLETEFVDVRNDGLVYFYRHRARSIIACVFGQDGFGYGQKLTDYTSLENGLMSVAEEAKRLGLTEIAIPYKIGCGLGGGSWGVVQTIIYFVFRDYPELKVKIYKYEQ